MELLKLTVLFALCLVNVMSMAIKGPVLTSYDPCGLGVIHFDKFSELIWRGVLHLGLYQNLIEVEIEINFEKKVKFIGASQNSTLSIRDDNHGFVIRPKKFVPKKYIFYLSFAEPAKNNTDIPVVTHFSMNNVTLCDDAIKASQTVESLDVSHDDEQMHVCGRRSLNHTEVMSVQTESQAGDWPWHVAIFITDPKTNNTMYYCGGNIISKTSVVTAGHCVNKNGAKVEASRITIVAGISNHKEIQIGRQSLPALEVILHPNYQGNLATADLAIIKVNRFKYTAYVQPICVWGPVYDKISLVGRQATVVGFGHDENNKPSHVLRSAYIKVQNDTTCIAYSPAVYTKLMNEFTFCAGYGPTSGTNPRNGDSGGGLVVAVMQTDHKVSWVLRGVLSKCGVSPGHTDCDPRFYVVYTDVGPHYGWIYHHSGLKFRPNIVYNWP